MIDYFFFFNRPLRSVDLNDFGKREHVKSEAENPPQRTSRQQVLNLTPKSTELQLSRPCHVVMPGERQVSARRSPQTPPQRWALSTWGSAPRAGDGPSLPAAEMLSINGTIRGWDFLKESVMFCLSFQVDLTSTSAAAKAKAAVNFLIYRCQNTYQKRLYRYTMVQREKMRPWEGRWPNGEQMSQPRATTTSPPASLHVLWRCPLAILHL